MTAATQDRQCLYRYPPGSFERRLYQRLMEVSLNPAHSQGFRTLAGQVQAGWLDIRPADLSTEAIRAALLDLAKAERKAHRKQWRAGKRDMAPFPEPWNAFIRTAKNGCRFAKWCRGDCDPSMAGDRQHWSIPHNVRTVPFVDSIGVQIFQDEASDGTTTPAQIIVSYYEDGPDYGDAYDMHLTPAEARKFGEALWDATAMKGWQDRKPGVLVDVEFQSGDRMVFERHRARTRKDGYADQEVFEISLYPVEEVAPFRMRSDYSEPSFLGRFLKSAADDAEGVVPPMFEGWEAMIAEAGR